MTFEQDAETLCLVLKSWERCGVKSETVEALKRILRDARRYQARRFGTLLIGATQTYDEETDSLIAAQDSQDKDANS